MKTFYLKPSILIGCLVLRFQVQYAFLMDASEKLCKSRQECFLSTNNNIENYPVSFFLSLPLIYQRNLCSSRENALFVETVDDTGLPFLLLVGWDEKVGFLWHACISWCINMSPRYWFYWQQSRKGMCCVLSRVKLNSRFCLNSKFHLCFRSFVAMLHTGHLTL